MAVSNRKYLFGGDKKWSKCDWTSCDDRVRGGNSVSYIAVKSRITGAEITQACTAGQDHDQDQVEGHDEYPSQAEDEDKEHTTSLLFSGSLDATALGGAGFASHRNTTNTREWNLADYDGIEIEIGKSDGKRYIFILKDEILPKKLDGKDRSSLNWEYEFVIPRDETARENSVVRIRWRDFLPTYRGRLKENLGRRLDVREVKRCNLMMRSFFGYQEGDFEIEIKSIAAFKEEEELEETTHVIEDGPRGEETGMGVAEEPRRRTPSEEAYEDGQNRRETRRRRHMPGRLLSACFEQCLGRD